MPDIDVRDKISKNMSKAECVDKSLSVFGSAIDSFGITPHDTNVLNFNAIYVGVTGNVAIKHTASGSVVTYTNVPAGFILPVKGGLVMTSSTASNMVGMIW